MFSRNSPSRCQDWIGFVSQYHIDHFDKLRGQIGFVSQKPIRVLAGRLSARSLRSSDAKLGSFRNQQPATGNQQPRRDWLRFAKNVIQILPVNKERSPAPNRTSKRDSNRSPKSIEATTNNHEFKLASFRKSISR